MDIPASRKNAFGIKEETKVVLTLRSRRRDASITEKIKTQSFKISRLTKSLKEKIQSRIKIRKIRKSIILEVERVIFFETSGT